MTEILGERLKSFSERLYQGALSIGNLDRKLLVVLFSIGLAIRIVGMFGLGDGDMEHFKAWASLTNTYGLEKMYSAPDVDLMARAREQGLSVVDSFNSLRTWATMQPLAFDAKESLVAYPPGSVYLMHLSGMAYKLISPDDLAP